MRGFRVCVLNFLAITLVAGSAWAQTTPAPLGAGLLAGLNFSTTTESHLASDESIKFGSGISVGGYVSFGIAPRIRIEPQFLISQKHFNFEDIAGNQRVDTFKIKLNYIDVPVLIRFDLTTQRPSFLFFGPIFSGRIGDARVEGFQGTREVEVDLGPDEVSGGDAGLVFGGGLSIGRMAVEGRITIGMHDQLVLPDNQFVLLDNVPASNRTTAKYRVVSILVRVPFGQQ